MSEGPPQLDSVVLSQELIDQRGFSRCLHFKEMAPSSLRRYFWTVQDLHLKGDRKDLSLQHFFFKKDSWYMGKGCYSHILAGTNS